MRTGFIIELNAKYVRSYRHLKNAIKQYKIYASNPDNLVRIWYEGDVVMETHE